MPRTKSLITVIRDLVHHEVTQAITQLFAGVHSTGNGRRKAKNGRRKRPRGKWRPGGPGRPPASARKMKRK
jgi:hypothetical protein